MTKAFWTVTSSDHFQFFIPIFGHCLRKAYPDAHVRVGVVGVLDDRVRAAMSFIPDSSAMHIPSGVLWKSKTKGEGSGSLDVSHGMTDYGDGPSVVNVSRFLMPPLPPDDRTIIMDVDTMLFRGWESIFDWHEKNMEKMKTCYSGYHGPWKKPVRFPGGWKGQRERVAGGSLMTTPEWLEKTRNARPRFIGLLEDGRIGTYREEDEVVLCKIMKESGLPVPKDKLFPTEHKGLHLGDFKFDHRWQDTEKMMRRLTPMNCARYVEMRDSDKVFQAILSICREDQTIDKLFRNLNKHLRWRARAGH